MADPAALILDEAAVAALLDMDEVITAMERALSTFSRREAVQPVRTMIPVAEHDGVLGVMPAYLDGRLGVKLVTCFPRNSTLPTHLATIMLFDPATGAPLVTMDGRLITEVRTAAVSAVATRLLARPDSSVLTLLGSGVQARSHLDTLRRVCNFSDIRVWSPHNAAAFAQEHGIRAAESAEEAVRGADVICTLTSSREPVLRGPWLKPGVHINAVGACLPAYREMDDGVLRQARIYVDSREAAFKESGDVIAAGQIAGELGQLINGEIPGRQSAEEITVFKSLGLAVEDVATAALVYDRAQAGDQGRRAS